MDLGFYVFIVSFLFCLAINWTKVMKTSKDMNKGEGFFGSFDVDAIHHRMQRLKEVDAGRNPNPYVNVRKTSRGLQNPNLDGEHAHVEGDLIGVSTNARRVSKVPSVIIIILDDTLVTNPNRVVGDVGTKSTPSSQPVESLWSTGGIHESLAANKGNPTSFSESIFGSTMNPGWSFGSNTDEPEINRPTDPNTFSSFSVDINAKLNSYAGVAGTATKDQTNVKSNFRSLVADKVFDGVNISIPRKIVAKDGLDAILEGVFEEDGISLIATYLGKPIMLDSYTRSMCKESWGRSSFARCLIEINSEADFIESNTIVVNRKRNNKGSSAGNKLPKGVPVSKGFQVRKEFAFQPRASNVGSNGDNGTRSDTKAKADPSKNPNEGVSFNIKSTDARQQDTCKKKISNIASPNPFAALGVDEDEEEEVENIWDESKNLNL
nr:zinc knuckle CX2CX4HX4C [Tanacetum cinerariifolium]